MKGIENVNALNPSFIIEDIPKEHRSNYGEIVRNLKLLDTSKSLVFKESEFSKSSICYLRSMVKRLHLGNIKTFRKDGKLYIWLNKI